MIVRAFDYSDRDYGEWTSYWNRAYPDAFNTEEDHRRWDQSCPVESKSFRFVAESGGQIGGLGTVETPHRSNPVVGIARFEIITANPEVAEMIFKQVEQESQKLEVKTLEMTAREDRMEFSFLQQHGFAELERMFESVLDVAQFEPNGFRNYVDRAAQHGIQLSNLAEHLSNPEKVKEVYGLSIALHRDVPRRGEFVVWDFDKWKTNTIESPKFMPEGWILASASERLVGISQLWKTSTKGQLNTGLTGVLPEYRRQGIAHVLKLRAVEVAKQLGAERISTQNHTVNRAMLSINEAMGFVKKPAMVTFRKQI